MDQAFLSVPCHKFFIHSVLIGSVLLNGVFANFRLMSAIGFHYAGAEKKTELLLLF